MPNENKEWEEDFDKKWFHFADKSVSTTLNQHRWSMKDVVRGYIAEATRRGKVDLLMEMQKMVMQLKTDWLEGAEGLTEESDKSEYFDDGWDQGGKVALLSVLDQIDSLIQQYGKEE